MPLLYSYRFCPYATRARMMLALCDIPFELREINLQNKPADFLEISPKGTVPVLQADNGLKIEESLDIMLWALKQHDVYHFFQQDETLRHEQMEWIKFNDTSFARNSYFLRNPHKFPFEELEDDSTDVEEILTQKCRQYIDMLETKLTTHAFLFRATPSLADVAVFPFVWILKNNVDWLVKENYPQTTAWLESFTLSKTFEDIMVKSQPWLGKDHAGVQVSAPTA